MSKINLVNKTMAQLFSWDFPIILSSYPEKSEILGFISSKDETRSLYLAKGKEIQKVTPDGQNIDDFKWVNENILYYLSNNNLFILDIKNLNFRLIKEGVSSI